jgi:hypothetical protein
MPRLERAHAIAALLAALLIPAASRLFGSGRLAWTMFSKTATYRLDITGARASGGAQALAPTALAALANGPVTVYLAGADSWRPTAAGPLLRAHLPELAALACRLGPFTAITLELQERASLEAPIRSTTAKVACAR